MGRAFSRLVGIWLVLGSVTLVTGQAGQEKPAGSLKDGDGVVDPGGLSREQLLQQVKVLQQSLAAANGEAELNRQRWNELRIRNEALGVDALTVDERRMEEKLVKAFQELYQTEKQRRSAVQKLQAMVESSQKLLSGATGLDPAKRGEYEVAVRGAKAFLESQGKEDSTGSALNDAKVVHVNAELGMVVVNAGSAQGVKIGMPFRVYEGDRMIGRLRIFQVRDDASGAVVENVEKGKKIGVGSRVGVAAEK